MLTGWFVKKGGGCVSTVVCAGGCREMPIGFSGWLKCPNTGAGIIGACTENGTGAGIIGACTENGTGAATGATVEYTGPGYMLQDPGKTNKNNIFCN